MAKEAKFTVDGKEELMTKLDLNGTYSHKSEKEDCDEYAEYVVKVKWIKTMRVEKAVRETGFFGNQNTVCRPRTDKWDYTVERLKSLWNIK